MRVGVITSNHLRHRFLANRLAQEFQVPLVLAEGKKRDPSRSPCGAPAQQELLLRYFAERSEVEAALLPEGAEWDRERIGEVADVPPGEINDPDWARRMWDADVQLIAVFGSSILKEPWLERFPRGMVNLHLGLSPYYRGSGTNFWPLYDERPAFVGATVHLIDAGVDSGGILRHARPEISTADTPHTIGNRAIRAGVGALIRSLREYAAGERLPVPQWETPDARYRRGADFTPEVLGEFLARWRGGLLPRALSEAPGRQPERLIGETSNE